jgi:hypothetical protein
MRLSYSAPAAIAVGLLGVFALGLTGCSQEASLPSDPGIGPDASPATMASQARLWLGIENAENVYIGPSEDAWLKESWYTEAQTFDIVVTNTSDFPVDDVYLLVTIPRAFKDVPGWSVQVGEVVLGPADFAYTTTDPFGFDGGSHGVYPPSGTGIFYPYSVGGTLGANASWTVPVIATRGTADGFRLHFDAGSTRLWTPPSHDVTVLPPVGGGPAPEACCFGDGHCELLTAEACVEAGGTAGGAGSSCDPNPCPPPAPTGACCLDGGGCEITTEEGCFGIGSYQGPGSLCGPDACNGD